MKTRFSFIPLLFLSALILLASCKKKSNEQPANPDYPQLIGTWTGFTDQGDTVTIKVNSIGSTLYVYSYKYAVTYDDGGTYSRHKIEISNTQGIAPILQKSFSLIPGDPFGSDQDTLSGTFDPDNLKMTGKCKTTFTDVTGHPVVWLDFFLLKQ